MAINPLPTPPAPTDSPQDFNTKAFDLLNALPDFVTEANAQAVQVDTDAGTATSAASTATGAASTATTKASEASDSADAAALSATEAAGLVENYQGALGSDPTLNKDGDPLVAGDWYVNTATGLIRAYDGAAWVTSLNVTAGVESFSAGSTGLTPSTGTTGDVTLAGTLGVANGGTGATSLTANNVLLGNGTSAVQTVAPGTAGNVLTSDGTGWTSAAPAPSAGTLEATASTSISVGKPVIIKTNGQVSQALGASAGSSNSSLGVSGTIREKMATTYVKSIDRTVTLFYDAASPDNLKAIISSTSSHGSPITISTGHGASDSIGVTYDEAEDRIIIAYQKGNTGTVIAASVTTSTITLGTPVTFSGGVLQNSEGSTIDCVYDKDTNQTVIAYINTSSFANAQVITVSGSTITVGTNYIFKSSNSGSIAAAYNPFSQRFIFVTGGNPSGNYLAKFSAGVLTFGSAFIPSQWTTNRPPIAAQFGSVGSFIIGQVNSSPSNQVRIYAVSVDDLVASPGSPNNAGTRGNRQVDAKFIYHEAADGAVVVYTSESPSGSTGALFYTTSGNNLATGTNFTFNNSLFKSVGAVAYVDTTFRAIRIFTVQSDPILSAIDVAYTNVLEGNFIGFSSNNYAVGQTATINTVGSLDTNQSGLSVGQRTFLQPTGALSTSPGNPSVFVGTPVSLTKIIVKG